MTDDERLRRASKIKQAAKAEKKFQQAVKVEKKAKQSKKVEKVKTEVKQRRVRSVRWADHYNDALDYEPRRSS